ncbi:MAG: transglycosylase domain-containing protein, partial [Pseudomonadota bacterium]
RHYFGVDAADLTVRQAAALASVLPAPKRRDPNALTPGLQRKAARVADGAATIRADGRAACFED